MNIIFWVLVILLGIGAWIALSFLFREIGDFVSHTARNVKDNIVDYNEEGK